MVLGAGAMQTMAALKRITAKNLGLASQGVGLVKTLLSPMRAKLANLLVPKHHVLLADLDRVGEDLESHRERIFEKFVIIVEDVVRGHFYFCLSFFIPNANPVRLRPL